MPTYYGYDENGRFKSIRNSGGPIGRRETTVPPPEGTGPWYWDGDAWHTAPRPKVSPLDFKMAWTSPERIKVNELKDADPVLADFWGIIEDPRLEVVDLSLKSVQDGVDYALDQLVTAGATLSEDKPARREQILSGTRL